MKKTLIFGLMLGLVAMFALLKDLSAEEIKIENDSRVLVGTITSLSYGQTNETYIHIKGEKIILSSDVKIFNEYNALCKIEGLFLPFMARVEILLDKAGEEQVVLIYPGEE